MRLDDLFILYKTIDFIIERALFVVLTCGNIDFIVISDFSNKHLTTGKHVDMEAINGNYVIFRCNDPRNVDPFLIWRTYLRKNKFIAKLPKHTYSGGIFKIGTISFIYTINDTILYDDKELDPREFLENITTTTLI